MMAMRGIKVFLLLGFAIVSVGALGQDPWLPHPPSFPQTGWHKIPGSLYMDLGDDPESLARLASSAYVADVPETVKSRSLTCPPSYKKFLIRSFFLGDPTARVYNTTNGLVVSSGAFSEPRKPDRGAIAICLKEEPKEIEGKVSFLK